MARVAELAVVVPLELGARLVEAVPAVAERVPAAADRIRREVVLARFVGKLAVDQGLRELRARIVPAAGSGRAADTAPEPTVETEPAAQVPVMESAAAADPTPTAGELALADYDHLSSAQIVAKLSGLEPAERAQIGAYERANRHRRTILGKIDQLGVA